MRAAFAGLLSFFLREKEGQEQNPCLNLPSTVYASLRLYNIVVSQNSALIRA